MSELPHVWAALMEMRMGGVMVSLAAVCDGTTSLYFSITALRLTAEKAES